MAKGLIYYDTQESENELCFGEHWPLLLREWKLGCARIGCPFWLSEKSTNVEFDNGLVNLWLIMMGMDLCRVWRVPLLTPAPPNHTQPHYRITCTITSPITPSNTTNTIPGNANNLTRLPQSINVIKNVMHAHSFINFWLHKPCHTQHIPYPSSVIINSSHHQQFVRWGTFRSAKTDSQFLRNLIFTPFTKVASAHPSMNYFQICWCHMIDETFSHTYIWTFSENVSVFIWQTIHKCQLFLRHPV